MTDRRTNVQRVQLAQRLATIAHAGQLRKYSGFPYIVHPLRVAGLVAAVGGRLELQIAAVLHDVVEDCGVELTVLAEKFGADVAEIVGWVTNPPDRDVKRSERKARVLARLAAAPAEVQTLKLCDRIDNLRELSEDARASAQAEAFLPVYRKESAALLEALTGAAAEARGMLAELLGESA